MSHKDIWAKLICTWESNHHSTKAVNSGEDTSNALEDFLLESLFVQHVKPWKGHLIHSLWRQILRSSLVPIHGFCTFIWMTDGTCHLILHPTIACKFYSRAVRWPSFRLAWDQPCVLPGVLVASWVLHVVCDPQLTARSKRLQGVIQRCSHKVRIGYWNGKRDCILCWEWCRCITITDEKAIKWWGKWGGSFCFLFSAVSFFLNSSWWGWQGHFSTPSQGSMLSFKKNKSLGARKQFWFNCCFIEAAVCAGWWGECNNSLIKWSNLVQDVVLPSSKPQEGKPIPSAPVEPWVGTIWQHFPTV